MRSSPFPILFAVSLAAGTVCAQRTLMQSYGNGAGARFGASLARVGDLDGDGFPELVTGSPNFSPSPLFMNTGAVTVVNGRTGAYRYQVGPLPAVNARAGTTVAPAGDLNGDGWPDFVEGAPNYNGGIGAVTGHNGLTGALLWTYNATGTNMRLVGTSIVSCGDVTGDGRPDLLVGFPSDVGGSPGVFRLNGANGTQPTSFASGSSSSQCGISIAALSDMTGDGRPEIAVGEPRFNFNGDSGRVRVMDPMVFWQPVYQLYASFAYDFGAGQLVANAGDVDGDGKDDLMVAYRGSSAAGPWTPFISLFSGTTGNPITTTGTISGDLSFGKAMAGVGDFDGDGRADYAIGAPDFNNGAGRVKVYSGRTFASIATIDGAAGSHFGTSIAPFGDYDGDGRADFAVGAPDHVYNGGAMGRVSVLGIRYQGALTFFGSGCASQANAPTITTSSQFNSPYPGGSFYLQGGNLYAAAASLWIWGFSNTVASSTPLPLDLTSFGIPGCNLLVSPDAITTRGSGNQVFTMPIPNAPSFAGVRLYLQAAGLGSVYPADISLSNGAELFIGHQ